MKTGFGKLNMPAIPGIDNIIELIKKGALTEAVEGVLKLRDTIREFEEEHIELRDESCLKDLVDKNRIIREPVYFLQNEYVKDGPLPALL
jgi:hypothetical protein